MRATIIPDSPAISEDLVERLMESHLDVVALVRPKDRPSGQVQGIDLSVFGTNMLAPTELRRRMSGCDIAYQDIYSFAKVDPLPGEDIAAKAAWAGSRLATFTKPRPRSIIEDVYTAPDAIVRVHLWSSGLARAGGTHRELSQPFVADPSLRPAVGQQMLEVTLIVPPRVSRMEEGLVLTGSEPVGHVFAELLHSWGSLRVDHEADPHRA
jgi:hypothetical protein